MFLTCDGGHQQHLGDGELASSHPVQLRRLVKALGVHVSYEGFARRDLADIQPHNQDPWTYKEAVGTHCTLWSLMARTPASGTLPQDLGIYLALRVVTRSSP